MENCEKEALAIEEAQRSNCKKRKVGAIIVEEDTGVILASGHNFNMSQDGTTCCEDTNGNTKGTVIHAEVAALENLALRWPDYKNKENCTIYVTHEPCKSCYKSIKESKLGKVHIVKKFMKFDTGKLRYSLIPPIFTKALASVLTYGAKKYKPNNWQLVDNTDRYWDALYRHLEARRSGEILDPESKLPHLWHAITNIGFILFLDNKKSLNLVQNDLSND